jgi:hypothetical protein
MRREGKRWNM